MKRGSVEGCEVKQEDVLRMLSFNVSHFTSILNTVASSSSSCIPNISRLINTLHCVYCRQGRIKTNMGKIFDSRYKNISVKNERPVDIRNRPRIPVPDEDPYSVAGEENTLK